MPVEIQRDGKTSLNKLKSMGFAKNHLKLRPSYPKHIEWDGFQIIKIATINIDESCKLCELRVSGFKASFLFLFWDLNILA